MKIQFFSILFTLVFSFAGYASGEPELNAGFSAAKVSLTSNVSPSRGMFGFTIGASQPLGGDGQLFGQTADVPHADFGAMFGFDYWKRNLNSFDYHIALNGKYVQYHFHHTPAGQEELTGYFRMLYYSIPFTLHLAIPNYPFIQAFAGVALAGTNLLPVQSGNLANMSYQTTLDLKWVASPELILGINFIEEKTDYFILRGSVNYSNFMLRNQSFGAYMSDGVQSSSAARRMQSGKFELQISIYPKWKFRSALGKDEGNNCPSPF